jgi:hypothetical protein
MLLLAMKVHGHEDSLFVSQLYRSINTYQPAGTYAEHPAGSTTAAVNWGAFENLDGAVNDAPAGPRRLELH